MAKYSNNIHNCLPDLIETYFALLVSWRGPRLRPPKRRPPASLVLANYSTIVKTIVESTIQAGARLLGGRRPTKKSGLGRGSPPSPVKTC